MELPNPSAAYAARLAARRATAAALAARLDRLAAARGGVFLGGLAVAALAFAAHLVSAFWLILPAIVFAGLVVRFELTRGGLAWAERAVRFYRNGIDRLAGQFPPGSDGSRFSDELHPYAADLDLFGPGSLFHRLCTARTQSGEDTLAAWLKAGAAPGEIAARQAAVADLAPRLDLREALAVAGADVPHGIDFAGVAAWGAAPPESPPGWVRWAVEVFGWANVFTLLGWVFVGTGGVPFAVSAGLSLALTLPRRAWARRVLEPVEAVERDLSLLETTLARLEREPFTAPRLTELQAGMRAAGVSPSAQIRELRSLLGWLNVKRNAMAIPVVLLRTWDTRYAFALERWRARSGPAVGHWLRAVGEVEALSSLAAFAFENPADVFPTVVSRDPESAEGARNDECPTNAPPITKRSPEPPAPVIPSSLEGHWWGIRHSAPPFLQADDLGHPLLPDKGCVRNDVRLGGADGPRLLVVSGSNMSGKSTLLRALGVNAVLALAGGVVRARRMTLSPVAVGATMRVQDSLQAGRSRFFAEVSKVRTLLDIAKRNDPPLLFLLDELFAGTNSKDRVAGAEPVLRALLDAGGVGLVTTHDLALTAVTDRFGGRAVNVHFSDGFAGGELNFDYTMRPGVVPHGNGLALMRAVGLEV